LDRRGHHTHGAGSAPRTGRNRTPTDGCPTRAPAAAYPTCTRTPTNWPRTSGATRPTTSSPSCCSSWTTTGRVSVEEFENLFWLFALAGNETLRNGIPGGMVALLEHP